MRDAVTIPRTPTRGKTPFWHNLILARDINGKGLVSPLDVLLVITEINQFGGHAVAAPPNPESAAFFFDVNHDHHVSPIDVLIIIDYLNAIPGSEGEGEAIAQDSRFDSVGWLTGFGVNGGEVSGSATLIDPSWVVAMTHSTRELNNTSYTPMRFGSSSRIYEDPPEYIVASEWHE